MYQNIKSRLVDENKLTVSIKNWYDFTNLKDFELHWQLVADNGSVLLEGNRKVVAARRLRLSFRLCLPGCVSRAEYGKCI